MKKLILTILFLSFAVLLSGAITLTAPDTIIVTGGSLGNEYNFQDIYTADTAGSWGLFFERGFRQYYCNADLYIGTDVDSGWFADTSVMVVFGTAKEFIVDPEGHLRLGELLNESTASTGNGCCIFFDLTGANDVFRVHGNIEAYSCYFLNSTRSSGMFSVSPDSNINTVRLWNCKVSEFAYTYEYGKWDMSADNWIRGNIENNLYGLNLTTGNFPDGHLNDTKIQHCDYGVRNTWLGYYQNDEITVRNLWITDSQTKDFLFFNWGKQTYTADFYAIDAICDWTINWSGCVDTMSRFHRQNSFNLKIVDQDGDSVNIATVKCWNVNDSLLFTITTDVHGEVTEQIIEYGWYQPDSGEDIILLSPHTLEVSKAGYNDIDVTWTMDEPVDWLLTLTDPCYPWTVAEINEMAASGFNHDSVANYPMSWSGTVLTCWGDNGGGGKYPMGYDADHPIEMEHIWAFSAYTKGTCICAKDNDDAFTMKEELIIGDGTNHTWFASENQAVWQYNYFKIKNHARMRIGSIATDISNPYAQPKWGSTWTVDRKTNPDGSYCYFVATGGSLFVYDSRIALTDNSKCFDGQAGSYAYFGYSTFGGYDRNDATYIRWFGTLKLDHLTNHHCRNFNIAGTLDTLSQFLVIYCNTNNLQVRDNEAWIYDATLIDPITCACKTLRFSSYGMANHVDPIGFNRTKVCVTTYAQNWQKMWHRFARRITTVDGDSVEGAIVEVWDIGDTLIYCDTTDVTGWTDMELILEWRTSGTGNPPAFTDYSPHRVKVYGEGILTYEQPLEIDERMDTWEIKVYRSPYNSIKGLE